MSSYEEYESVLRNYLNSSKNLEEKINKLAEIMINHTRLLEHILHCLSPQLQKKIFTNAGFKEEVWN